MSSEKGKRLARKEENIYPPQSTVIKINKLSPIAATFCRPADLRYFFLQHTKKPNQLMAYAQILRTTQSYRRAVVCVI
jgi:hypothetical protein